MEYFLVFILVLCFSERSEILNLFCMLTFNGVFVIYKNGMPHKVIT